MSFNDPNIQTNMLTAQNLQDVLNRYAPPNSKGLSSRILNQYSNYVNANVLAQHFYLRL